MRKTKVSEIEVTKYEFKPELVTKDATELEEIKKLLPSRVPEKISFRVSNCNPAVANAIRREVISGLKWKCLHVEIDDITTNEPYLKLHEFCKRIAYIPLDQDTPLDAVFSINVKNTNMHENRMIVHSDAIKGKSKSPYDLTYRIAELHPGNYLQVNRVTVREGYSWKNDEPDGANSKFSPTSNIEYDVLDYKYVTVMNEKQQFYTAYVKTSDLKLGDADLGKRILIMADKSYADALDKNTLGGKKYEFSEKIVIGSFRFYQSTEVKPQDFRIGVRTLGNIDARDLIRRTIECILEKLTRLDNLITAHLAGDASDDLVITESADLVTSIKVLEEKHTLAHLLVTTILELDPQIEMVNWQEPHVQEQSMILKLKHPEPIKITRDAITFLTSDFSEILRSFQ